MLLTNSNITLRAIEPEDLEFLYQIENNEIFWEVSHTQTPFSRFLLRQYLDNAHLDIYQAKQLRLMIENTEQQSVGMIDLFDFNPQHRRAGVGIVIHPNFQERGFADQALSLLIKYGFSCLNLHQLYANITIDNSKSLALFAKHNFKQVGVKKDWILTKNRFKDEILLQLINE